MRLLLCRMSVHLSRLRMHTWIDVRSDVSKTITPFTVITPAQWQADLMFLPYTNAKNETRLHAIFCIVNIKNKYAFARVLPFTATRGGRDADYDPSEPLDENGERGVNINGQRYKVKVKGQAYSQAKTISALRSILDVMHQKRRNGWKPKFPEIKTTELQLIGSINWVEI